MKYILIFRKSIFCVVWMIFIFNTCISQNAWIQKSNLPGPGRFDAAGFVIGNSAFITCGDTLNTGNDYLNDLCEWDQQTDAWTQKANFPGIPRRGCFSFAIGVNGYVGGGQNVSVSNLVDFWEYSSSNNVWTQKTNAPGLQHDRTKGFSINQFGYIIFAGGDSVLHKYNPSLDNGSQVNYLPFQVRGGAVVFVIGNNAYVGIGAWQTDFWKFESISENWVQIADFPGPKRTAATAFSIYGFGYVGCGFDTFAAYSTTFYAYDTLNNQWNAIANFPAGGNTEAVGFSINGKGYLCTGASPFPPAAKYLWEYSPIVGISESNEVNSIRVSPNPFNTILNISFENPTNAQLFFRLYNSTGKMVKCFAMDQSPLTIETNSLVTGLYFYDVSNQSNIKIDSGKLIKVNY